MKILEDLNNEIKRKEEEILLMENKNKEAEREKKILQEENREKKKIIDQLNLNDDKITKKIFEKINSIPVERQDNKFDIHKNFDIFFKDFFKTNKIVLKEDMESSKTKIKLNLISNLFKTSFDKIEKEILIKKLGLVLKNLKDAVILCEMCNKVCIYYYCNECKEFFCMKCKLDHSSNHLWKQHNLKIIDLNLVKNILSEDTNSKFKSLNKKNSLLM